MELSNQYRHRRFLLVDMCIIPTGLNLVINGIMAWILNLSSAVIVLWGMPSISIDLVATAFLLPFLTCIIVSKQVANQVRSGKIPPLPPEQFPLVPLFRRSSSMRGFFLGTAGILFGAIPVLWALGLGQAQPFPLLSFVVFKAIWSALLASLVTPVVGWWALASVSRTSGLINRSS